MKVKNASVINFGSYNNLEFNFSNLGLSLISGATGSGKSTLQDIVPWVLYGITAKGGRVDEVKAWNSNGEPTRGVIEVLTKDGTAIKVTRVRGNPTSNDLYWEINGIIYRGKDIPDSQNILSDKLGVSEELYIAACYYNEFSSISSFFTSKAKERRSLLEKLSDLSIPLTLLSNLSSLKKDINKDYQNTGKLVGSIEQKIETNRLYLKKLEQLSASWDENHAEQLIILQLKGKNFDKEKQSKLEAIETKIDFFISTLNSKIDKIKTDTDKMALDLEDLGDETCSHCKQPNSKYSTLKTKLLVKQQELKSLLSTENPHLEVKKQIISTQNTFDSQVEQKVKDSNQYTRDIIETKILIQDLESNLIKVKEDLENYTHNLFTVDQMFDVCAELKAELLKKSIKDVETKTNDYLTKYFDSEIKVGFEVKNTDDLDVTIQKNSFDCSYSQLSKGQRGLLKLCFSIAVMKVAANQAGIHFETLFFDEALDGLDVDLKEKAFNLFTELEMEHSSILVVEHSPNLQNLFDNKYEVSLIGDNSEIRSHV